jgi:hypothetical protein
MRHVFLVIGCVIALPALAQDDLYPDPNGYADPARDRGWYSDPLLSDPYYVPNSHYTPSPAPEYNDYLQQEIDRLEKRFCQGTPAASSRYGVTARFGPQWSPYFWERAFAAAPLRGEMPGPNTPTARQLLVELAGRALRGHDSMVTDRLLEMYELRALRRLAEDGVPPSVVAADLQHVSDRNAARRPALPEPTPAGSTVKVATYREATGYLLKKGAGREVLDTITFVPDESENILLMVSLEASMERLDDQPSTTAVGLDIELPPQEAGIHDLLAGPTISLHADDPALVRRGGSSLCTADAETLYGGLHNQPRYTFWLVAPKGAPSGDVWVSEIVVRAYYITGFVEAGHFE